MARQSKATRFLRLGKGIKNLREGKRRPMPGIHVDGSISTKPSVPCPPLPEYKVMELVHKWLLSHGCVVDRLNNGAGRLMLNNGQLSQYQVFGIRGGGDWIGWLPNGRHLEIECKKGTGGKLSRVQIKRMKKCRDSNAVYLVIHGVPELENKLLPILENLS